MQAPSYGKWHGHDGDGLRIRDVQGSSTTYYLRSTVLGGKVVAELSYNGQWYWSRGYVYAGEQMVAVQNGANLFVHQDPITKSQRITNSSGAVVEAIELDPFGGETNRSWGSQYQKHRYTTWERDWTGDESLFRRYHGWWSRFAHPDPYDGSYNLADPQSLNRYAYVQNDPVNSIDPSGLSGELQQGIDAARMALQGGFCRNFLGGMNALNMFNTYVSNNLIGVGSRYPVLVGSQIQYRNFRSADTGAVTTTATGSYMVGNVRVSANRITINQNGFYFSGRIASGQFVTSVRGGGFEGLNMSQVRGAVIIHEFAHALGRIPSDDPTALKDGGRQSRANAELIRLVCFSSLNNANRPISTTMPPLLNNPLMRQVGGGGDIGGGYIGGGYPGWWYSMWSFVAWVNSIPVGGYGQVIGYDIDDPEKPGHEAR